MTDRDELVNEGEQVSSLQSFYLPHRKNNPSPPCIQKINVCHGEGRLNQVRCE